MWENIEAYAEKTESKISSNGPFLGAKYEQNDGYDIAWFVWERDGIVPQRIIPHDWEPIILYWRRKRLIAVEGRPHFGWKFYHTDSQSAPNCITSPIKVIFATSQHTPRIKNTQDRTFDRMLDNYDKLDYQFESVLTEDVPGYARKPRIGRTGIALWVGEDIHSHVKRRMKIL